MNREGEKPSLTYVTDALGQDSWACTWLRRYAVRYSTFP